MKTFEFIDCFDVTLASVVGMDFYRRCVKCPSLFAEAEVDILQFYGGLFRKLRRIHGDLICGSALIQGGLKTP